MTVGAASHSCMSNNFRKRKTMMAQLYNTRVRVPNITSSGLGTDSSESHDDLPSKPNGRGRPDDGVRKGRPLLQCRKTAIVSTMNVRTIREQRGAINQLLRT